MKLIIYLPEKPVQAASIFIIWLFIVSALIGIALGYQDWFITKTPLNLLLGATLLAINFPIHTRTKIGYFAFAFLVGMTIEIAGVNNDWIFGAYYYGENLGWKVFEVPLLIGVNWAILTFICAAMGKKITQNPLPAALIGAAFMVVLDFFMEQVAHQLDFWHFAGNLAPFRNYVTWFVVSFLLQYGLLQLIPINDQRFSAHLYFAQFCFFVGCVLLL